MSRYSFTHVPDHVLPRELTFGIARERGATADVLALIAEFDARRLYLSAAYPTMFAYLVGESNLTEAAATHKGLPSVWARMKIAALADQSTYQPDPDLPGQIKQLALDYSLMSAFTAFVAVDSTRRTEGAQGTAVPVAVPVPDGVKCETTVDEK